MDRHSDGNARAAHRAAGDARQRACDRRGSSRLGARFAHSRSDRLLHRRHRDPGLLVPGDGLHCRRAARRRREGRLRRRDRLQRLHLWDRPRFELYPLGRLPSRDGHRRREALGHHRYERSQHGDSLRRRRGSGDLRTVRARLVSGMPTRRRRFVPRAALCSRRRNRGADRRQRTCRGTDVPQDARA